MDRNSTVSNVRYVPDDNCQTLDHLIALNTSRIQYPTNKPGSEPNQ